MWAAPIDNVSVIQEDSVGQHCSASLSPPWTLKGSARTPTGQLRQSPEAWSPHGKARKRWGMGGLQLEGRKLLCFRGFTSPVETPEQWRHSCSLWGSWYFQGAWMLLESCLCILNTFIPYPCSLPSFFSWAMAPWIGTGEQQSLCSTVLFVGVTIKNHLDKRQR